MSPDDDAIGMVAPDGFRLQESRPAALDSSLVKRGVLLRLSMWEVWWPDNSPESGADEACVRLPCASRRRPKRA